MTALFANRQKSGHHAIQCPKRSPILLAATALSGLFIFCAAPTAQAGFRWTPPAVEEPAPLTPATPTPARPSETFLPAPIAPQAPLPIAPDAMTPFSPTPLVNTPAMSPVTPTTLPVYQAPQMIGASPAFEATPQGTQGLLEGFGRDMPILLALKQIVPAHYALSLSPDIDEMTSLSWEGGQPWSVVLRESLAAQGMNAVIEGSTIRVFAGAQPPVIATATATPAASPAPIVAPAAPIAPVAPSPVFSAPRQAPPPPSMTPTASIDHNYSDLTLPTGKAPVKAAMSIPAGTVVESIPLSADAPNNRPVMRASASMPPVEPDIMIGTTPSETISETVVINQTDHQPRPPTMMDDAAPVTKIVPKIIVTAPDTAPLLSEEATDSLLREPSPSPKPTEIAQPVIPKETWYGEEGQSLRYVLENWSDLVGTQIFWKAPRDYQLPETITMQGNYVTAIETLLGRFDGDNQRPVGHLYRQPDGPTILVIDNAS